MLLVSILALSLAGCLSGQTRRALDRAHATSTDRLRQRERGEAEPELDPSAPLDRDATVALAVARSPSIQGLAHRARALVHAGRADGALPAAELAVAAWNLPLARPYAVGDADMYMIDLRQRLPAAGSLDARARAAAEEAAALLAELSAEERLVAQRAADAYAEYEQALRSRSIQRRQMDLLERMGQGIRARYTTGGSALADAARIDLEIGKSRRALARLEGDIVRARSSLNALLRRPPAAPLAEPREGDAETIRLPIEELLAKASAHRGPVLAAEARMRAAQARREAAEAEARVPEFTLGLGYWQDPRMRPGLGVSASMSLPWLWGPQRERSAEAHEAELAETSARDASGVESQTEVTEAHARLVAFEDQLLVVHREALPAARRSIDALAAAYATGNASLLDWLDGARSVLDLEMEGVDLRGQLAHSIAALERAVGAPLPRVALAPKDVQ